MRKNLDTVSFLMIYFLNAFITILPCFIQVVADSAEPLTNLIIIRHNWTICSWHISQATIMFSSNLKLSQETTFV